MTASATKVQEKAATIAAGSGTFAATFDTPATAGNLIVWVAASDGNAGTTTQPTDTPNLPISLKSNDVSLQLAWGVADGGETTISGTVSSNVAGGRCWILELADATGTGSWARRYTSTVFTSSGGSTSADAVIPTATAATEGGYGLAAATWDAIATAGTAAWSNSWVKDFDGSSGTAVSLWTATKSGIASGSQESTTLTRTGGTAEQLQAFLTVFGKDTPVTITGALAASIQLPVSALTGLVRIQGALGATLQLPTGALQGSPVDRAQLVASLPRPVAALTGTPIVRAALATVLPPPVGAIAGTHPSVGQLDVTLQLPRMWIHEALPELVVPLTAGAPELTDEWSAGVAVPTPNWSAGEPEIVSTSVPTGYGIAPYGLTPYGA